MDETYISKRCEDLHLALERNLDRIDFSKRKFKKTKSQQRTPQA